MANTYIPYDTLIFVSSGELQTRMEELTNCKIRLTCAIALWTWTVELLYAVSAAFRHVP